MKTLLILLVVAVSSSFAQASTCTIDYKAPNSAFFNYSEKTEFNQTQQLKYGPALEYTLTEVRVSPDSYFEVVKVAQASNHAELNCNSSFVRNAVGAVVATKSECPVSHQTSISIECSLYDAK